jgi:predicted Zn-dependent protease
VREEQTIRVLHRDILRIMALILCTIGLFFLTKMMAVKEQKLDSRIAAMWYRKGQEQIASGAVGSAIDSFRNATTNDRDNPAYVLGLADALASANHLAEAEQALLRLRESTPEDAEINLQLARLAAKSGDIRGAARYYHDALYGLMRGPQVDEQRQRIRAELVSLLLDHHDHDQALSELLVMDAELPHTPAAHVKAGQLFLEAGDAHRALSDFEEAIQLDRHNPAALSGAEEAAASLGYEKKARAYQEMRSHGDQQ